MTLTIEQRLDALVQAYRDKGQDPSEELLPGLTPAEIAAEITWFPAALPRPLLELYGWRNGQPQDAWSTQRVLWFRDMQFTSLQRARFEYESMMSSYGVDNTLAADRIDLRTAFPFASFNGGWYVMPCAPHAFDPAHPLPVVCVFQGINVHYHSMGRMLDTCLEWRKASTWVDDDWVIDDDIKREIWDRNNPGIFGRSS